MIILTNTTDSIQVKLAANITTSQLECFASYRDTTLTSITPGRNIVLTSNTTAVNLVATPSVSTQRIIDYMSVYNSDSASATVSFIFNDNGTSYELSVSGLRTGEKIEYNEGNGFKSYDINGFIKKSRGGEDNTITGFTTLTLTSDSTNSNAVTNSIADITGYSFSYAAGSNYWFQFIMPFTSSVVTTGARFSITASTAATFLSYYSKYSLAANSETFNYGLAAFDLPAAANASPPASLVGVAIVEGVASFSTAGYMVGRFASEVSNSEVRVKAGAIINYKQLN